ncbi:hypothetical protein D9613_008641 [Agrocybe pediades]|uniref:Uncharacterized protein n=1 Tax=Agrocybe pediades TaxID=84607 RepID=A0A8H4QTQ7_9AGAR|nr:hypothetical protein D9613_008641 [Agrocybe pediades]
MATTLLTRKKLDVINDAEDPEHELTEEEQGKWFSKKMANSMAGRVVRSSYETLRSTGTNVICLSPWGDSSPFMLPCVRFRDFAIHLVHTATGGATSLITAPIESDVTDMFVGSLLDTILVEIIDEGIQTVADMVTDPVNEWLEDMIEDAIPVHSKRLTTTHARDLKITLKYKHASADASLGFFRSSIHKDLSITSRVKDYLSIEKGWFSPYLYASGRRPIIPRYVKPDIGAAILKDSETVINLVKLSLEETLEAEKLGEVATPEDPEKVDPQETGMEILDSMPELDSYSAIQPTTTEAVPNKRPAASRLFGSRRLAAFHADKLEELSMIKEKSRMKLEKLDEKIKERSKQTVAEAYKMKEQSKMKLDMLDEKIREKSKQTVAEAYKFKEKSVGRFFNDTKHASPSNTEPLQTPSEPAKPRIQRMAGPHVLMTLVGLKPYRHMWTQSARPNESVFHYILLNGCPTLVIPVKAGTPLVAWDTLTLEHLWKVDLPPEDGATSHSGKFEGIVGVLLEYLDFCVDWERMITPDLHSESKKGPHYPSTPQAVLRHAVTLLVAAAVRTKDSKQAKKKVDPERCGIAFWRLP